MPLCKFFKECDLSICVTCDYDIRLNRLTKRLSDKSIYNEGDRSFWSYKEGILEKRIDYTTLNKYGYFSNYYIDNSKGLNELYENTEKLVEKMLGGYDNMDLVENTELLDLYTADKKSIREIWVVKNKNIKIEDLKFRDNEVMDAKFASIDELKDMLHENKAFNNLSYFVELYNNI